MNNKDIWIFLFLSGMLCFNWPFLEIFAESLPLYFFLAWPGFILIMILLSTRKSADHDPDVDV
ncbi:MAG: hypothetical protein A2521_04685 [Deltaproteobacteria bacterium RIFOXYD12_FULL_57_12]|nr:MAG: hypothetical protein A2521_04685 [Deltaproteobacteria bacterium RIFOXYD12_FULL_57_12]